MKGKGEKLMRKSSQICCICGKTFTGWGNNPYPVVKSANTSLKCCDAFNLNEVMKARIKEATKLHRRVMPDEV